MANDFLQDVFDTEALTFDQFSEKLGDRKLADLSLGEHVGKGKYDDLESKYDNAVALLNEANAKLEGYDPDWQAKATNAQTEADAKAASVIKNYAVNAAVKAANTVDPDVVAMLLDREKITVDGDTITGIDEQLDELRTNKPYLFNDNGGRPRFSSGTGGGQPTGSNEDAQVAARYANNPWYTPKK